jgi:riboflavin kinase/FMN adenylyltransferase
MLNLGPRPTFGDQLPSIEVHLFETEQEYYGMRVRIDFVARLRDTLRFDGPDALVAQLKLDAISARRALLATA